MQADKRFFTLVGRHFTIEDVADDDASRKSAYNRDGTYLMRMRQRDVSRS